MSDGYLTDQDDLHAYVDYCRDLLTSQKASRWVDPDQMENFQNLEEELQLSFSELNKIYVNEGRMPERGKAAMPLKNMRLMALDSNDELLAWWAWRKDNVELTWSSDGRPLGYGGKALKQSLLLPASAVIKHTYHEKPKSIRLSLKLVEQEEKKVFIGSARANELDSVCRVPWMDPTMDSHEFGRDVFNDVISEDNWQRVVDTRRVMNIASFIDEPEESRKKDRKYMFNPILIYISEDQESNCYKVIEEQDDGTKVIEINFDFLEKRNAGLTDYVPLPGKGDTRPVIICDGQHRVRGLVCSERGSTLELPFVMIIGDGSKDDQRLIAEIFTQINTKSVPVDALHKTYLSYKFGMKGTSPSDQWDVEDWNSNPIKPSKESRPQRRAYELALYLAHAHKSPLYDMIEFQRPATAKGRKKAHICVNALNWVSSVRKWFLSGAIYSSHGTDNYFHKEAFNFFKAFEENAALEWVSGDEKWKVGAGRNKPLLQYEGPFLSLLDLYPLLVTEIRNSEVISNDESISKETFMKYLLPLSTVNWTAPSIQSLRGRTNTNIRHLVMWMIETIRLAQIPAPKQDVTDPNIKSVIGKGIIAPPGKSKITKMGGPNWPDLSPIQLRMEYLPLTLSSGWTVQLINDSGPEEIKTDNIVSKIRDSDGNIIETHLSIDDMIPKMNTKEIRIQAWLSNGNGKTLTDMKTYPNPNFSVEQ